MLGIVIAGAGIGLALSAWGIVRGAAMLRSPEEQARLDEEQAEALAEMRKGREG